LICTARHRIPASASTNERIQKRRFAPPQDVQRLFLISPLVVLISALAALSFAPRLLHISFAELPPDAIPESRPSINPQKRSKSSFSSP
jgi:hypothetical protein